VPRDYYSLSPRMRMAGGPGGFAEQMKTIPGMVLKQVTTLTMMSRMTLTEVAASVKEGPIAPSVFEVPAGFRRAASP
jgi:hypothetical protein